MEVTIRPFVRKISNESMELFVSTAAGGENAWLREALADPKLFFALRDERIDVYFRGQVIYSIDFKNKNVTPRTHVKYLILDGPDPRIKMQNGSFAYTHKHLHLQDAYQGTATLEQIKRASERYSGDESKGIYKVINRDPLVVDVEIAFNASNEIAEHNAQERQRTQDRVDMVRLTPSGGGFDLVFWEAKHYSNPELFREDIFGQLSAYSRQLHSREDQLIAAFRNVCRFHHNLDRLRRSLGIVGASDNHTDILEGIASDKYSLRLVKEPSLFVFGFDNDQKNGRWKARKKQIEDVIGSKRLRAVGDPVDGLTGKKMKDAR